MFCTYFEHILLLDFKRLCPRELVHKFTGTPYKNPCMLLFVVDLWPEWLSDIFFLLWVDGDPPLSTSLGIPTDFLNLRKSVFHLWP